MQYNKITISGKICTGKTTLLKNLQNKLKWPIFLTGNFFRDYVRVHNLDLEQADEQKDKLTKEIDYKVRDLLNKKGPLLVDGWMSGIMANSVPNVLKILLICDDNVRYQRFANREKISIEEAKKRVEDRQNNWFRKIEAIHKINPKEFTNEKNYDLVIDTTVISSQEILKKVLSRVIPN